MKEIKPGHILGEKYVKMQEIMNSRPGIIAKIFFSS
jgi:hypothetical protein